MEKRSRWKSPAAFGSFVSLLLMILGHLGVYEKIGIEQSVFQQVADSILAILIAFGIYNNPTSKKSF